MKSALVQPQDKGFVGRGTAGDHLQRLDLLSAYVDRYTAAGRRYRSYARLVHLLTSSRQCYRFIVRRTRRVQSAFVGVGGGWVVSAESGCAAGRLAGDCHRGRAVRWQCLGLSWKDRDDFPPLYCVPLSSFYGSHKFLNWSISTISAVTGYVPRPLSPALTGTARVGLAHGSRLPSR